MLSGESNFILLGESRETCLWLLMLRLYDLVLWVLGYLHSSQHGKIPKSWCRNRPPKSEPLTKSEPLEHLECSL